MKKFYCYLKNGEPVILETEPEDFEKKEHKHVTRTANERIALLRYQAFLKIKNWRSA